MAKGNFGALGATFTVVRAMEAISLITIIGMTANFISEMVQVDQSPPKVLIGTLSVVSLSSPYLQVQLLTNNRLVSQSSTVLLHTSCTSMLYYHF